LGSPSRAWSRRLGARLLFATAHVGATLGASATFVQAEEPACVVTYSVDSSREIDVTGAVCDDPSLEMAALVFAFARLEGPFREMLVMQAPVQVEFTFSEALIRAHAEGSGAI
jgi:hypothetical protein